VPPVPIPDPVLGRFSQGGGVSRFLSYFENAAVKATDAPQDFIDAAGLMCISTIALGRRWIPRGADGLHPNLYMMLTAGSSVDRKTSCVRLVRKMIEQVDSIRVGMDDFSAESLVAHMRTNSNGKGKNKLLLPIGEFGNFLSNTKTWGVTLSSTLCKIYDGETIMRKRSGLKATKVINPKVSMFAAVAYAFLEEHSRQNDWATGFYPRILWVTPENRRPQFPVEPVFPQQDFDLAVVQLTQLRQDLKARIGPMDLTPAAQAQFIAWNNLLQISGQDDPADFDAIKSRLGPACLKLSLIYQLDDNPSIDIQVQAMDKAIALCDRLWKGAQNIYLVTSEDRWAKKARRIKELLRQAGSVGMQIREIYRAAHLKVSEAKPLLDALVVLKQIEPVTGGIYVISHLDDGT